MNMLWKKLRSFSGSRLTLSQQHVVFENVKVYMLKSNQDLLFFIKQVSESTRFVKLKRSQKLSSLFLSELELLISVLKSPLTIRFSYLHKALLITSFISSKNVLIFRVDGGLTNSISPPPWLCLYLLALTLHPLS